MKITHRNIKLYQEGSVVSIGTTDGTFILDYYNRIHISKSYYLSVYKEYKKPLTINLGEDIFVTTDNILLFKTNGRIQRTAIDLTNKNILLFSHEEVRDLFLHKLSDRDHIILKNN
jgi:hypothetical protein